MEENYGRFVLKGLAAGSLLLAFYLITASLLGGFSFAIDNFLKLWYWMIPLIAGFGVQIGMFFYVKEQAHKKAAAQAAASTGISSASMVACCAHHIADIAPFLGIAALGLFLAKYQPIFLFIGISSNILGIVYMASLMETKIPKARIKLLLYSLLVLSIIIVSASYFYVSKASETKAISTPYSFQTLVNGKNDVEFQVTPLAPNEFRIAMNTHSVDLDFDLVNISTLHDNFGKDYYPVEWKGSEPGGHHRNGILRFPNINTNAKSVKLIIKDSTRREFEWSLR